MDELERAMKQRFEVELYYEAGSDGCSRICCHVTAILASLEGNE